MAEFVKMGGYKFNQDYIKYAYLSNAGTCNVVLKNTNKLPDSIGMDTEREFKPNTPEYRDCVNFLNQKRTLTIFSF